MSFIRLYTGQNGCAYLAAPEHLVSEHGSRPRYARQRI
jgi:hypothetical protein